MKLARLKSVSILSFDNQKSLNSLSHKTSVEFGKAVENAAKNSEVLILTGEGKAFSSGGNLDWLRERAADSIANNEEEMFRFYGSFLKPLSECPIPTIAMVNGAAIGAGACLTLACDFRIISSTAKVSFNFTKLGISPGMGGSLLLPKLIGYEQAAMMLLTGRSVDGVEASKLGLCLDSANRPELLSKTIELAGDIASCSATAVGQTLNLLRQRKFQGLDIALRKEASEQALAFSGKDFLQSISATR